MLPTHTSHLPHRTRSASLLCPGIFKGVSLQEKFQAQESGQCPRASLMPVPASPAGPTGPGNSSASGAARGGGGGPGRPAASGSLPAPRPRGQGRPSSRASAVSPGAVTSLCPAPWKGHTRSHPQPLEVSGRSGAGFHLDCSDFSFIYTPTFFPKGFKETLKSSGREQRKARRGRRKRPSCGAEGPGAERGPGRPPHAAGPPRSSGGGGPDSP